MPFFRGKTAFLLKAKKAKKQKNKTNPPKPPKIRKKLIKTNKGG